MYQVVAVSGIFVAAYFFIVTERLHRTTVALAGALAVLLLPGLSFTQDEAVRFIDFNTLGLLLGMMLIVAILKRSGVFRYLALRVASGSKGRVFVIFGGFGAITAVASAFIDNVTTVLMLVPIIYLISDLIGRSAVPFLVMVIIMANLGGMATMIGDPPNILVGSRAVIPGEPGGLSFLDFLLSLGPLALICVGASLFMLRLSNRSGGFFAPFEESKARAIASMDPRQAIRDTGVLRRSLAALSLVLVGFLLHHELGLMPATVALAGAALLLIATRINPEEVLAEVEWGVLVFFMGLFVLVGALEKVGVIAVLARGFLSISENPAVLVVLVLWLTAVTASLISAVPTVTVLIPLVQVLVDHVAPGGGPKVALAFWWALAAGACLGGNATLVGAAANMAVAGMAAKEREPLSFAAYARTAVPITAVCLAITTVYVLARYLS
jgi:Na+/H+ antiporter NhaD/arsenite permease-like protein